VYIFKKVRYSIVAVQSSTLMYLYCSLLFASAFQTMNFAKQVPYCFAHALRLTPFSTGQFLFSIAALPVSMCDRRSISQQSSPIANLWKQ